MDKLEKDVRDTAEAFLTARKAARDAGYLVHWQTSDNVDSVVVSGGPEPVLVVKPETIETILPAPRVRDSGL
jgi:hypothetical protein